MEKLKPLLKVILSRLDHGQLNAEVREAWLDAFPEDATKEEKANREKHAKLRAKEAAEAAAAK